MCLFKASERSGCRLSLLQALGNGHGDCDGRADHGVVAHAQEAHHLDGKAALRRL